MSKDTGSPRSSEEIKPSNISALHEVDNNSLYLQRELPDSGKVELLDENSPSGSGNEISEMPQPPAPAPVPLCELGTRHTSVATSTLSDTALDMIWEDYDMSWESPRGHQPSLLSLSSKNIEIRIQPDGAERGMREYPSLSSLSTDKEIVVPPGTPNSQIPSSPISQEAEPRTRFF